CGLLFVPLALDFCEQAITAPADGFDVKRMRRRIVQCAAQPVDGAADAVIEIDERAVRPQAVTQLLARHHFAAALTARTHQLEGAILQLDANTIFREFAAASIDGEDTKPVLRMGLVLQEGPRRTDHAYVLAFFRDSLSAEKFSTPAQLAEEHHSEPSLLQQLKS